MYFAYEVGRTLAQPLNLAASMARTLYGGLAGASRVPGARSALAAFEMMERATRRYAKPAWELTTTTIGGVPAAVTERRVLHTPFCDLVHFERHVEGGMASQDRKPADPRVLVVAPLSGHHATLVRETVRELLPAHDVYVTDWIDARLVPRAEGPFDLHDYIDLVARLLGELGEGAHVIAVCQPCAPVLAAVARMADEGDARQPASMTLMSGPIDPRVNPTKIGVFAADHSLRMIETTLVHRVPPGQPGLGRRVYPGILQLQAFMAMNPTRHAESHWKHFLDVASGDEAAAEKHRKFYDEYFAVMDLPAEFYLQTVGEIFQEHLLARGQWQHRGALLRPEAIEKTALLTVEGGQDDITAPGQTVAAHALCSGIPAANKRHHLQADVGHYGTFSGGAFRREVAPIVAGFIREND